MGHRGVQRYCPTCERPVLAHQQRPNHVLHLILTLITGGLWLIVWIVLSLGQSRPRCTFCGSSRLEQHVPKGRFVAQPGSAALTYQPDSGQHREDAPKISLGLFIVIVIAVLMFASWLTRH